MSASEIDRALAARDRAVFELWRQHVPMAEIGRRLALHINALPHYLARARKRWPDEAMQIAVPRIRPSRVTANSASNAEVPPDQTEGQARAAPVPREHGADSRPAHHGRPAISFTPEQQAEIMALRREGCTIGEISVRFGVNWRVIRRNLPSEEPSSRCQRKLTAEQCTQIRALSAAGQSQIAIARQLMISPHAVQYWVRRPEEPACRWDDPDRRTRRIAFTAEECASIVARHHRGESCYSIAKTFALNLNVIRRLLREAGITITDEAHRRAARNARILGAALRGSTIPAIAAELILRRMVVYHVVAKAARTIPGLAYKPRGRHASLSEREQIRDLWAVGLPYRAIAERLGFTRGRVATILLKMRQRGEIGARPVALRAVAALRPMGLPAAAVPTVLLQMAQDMGEREIAEHWHVSAGAMRQFLRYLSGGAGLADPILPPAVTVIRSDQVPALLLQLARGVPPAEIARQWRVNPDALRRFFWRQIEACATVNRSNPLAACPSDFTDGF